MKRMKKLTTLFVLKLLASSHVLTDAARELRSYESPHRPGGNGYSFLWDVDGNQNAEDYEYREREDGGVSRGYYFAKLPNGLYKKVEYSAGNIQSGSNSAETQPQRSQIRRDEEFQRYQMISKRHTGLQVDPFEFRPVNEGHPIRGPYFLVLKQQKEDRALSHEFSILGRDDPGFSISSLVPIMSVIMSEPLPLPKVGKPPSKPQVVKKFYIKKVRMPPNFVERMQQLSRHRRPGKLRLAKALLPGRHRSTNSVVKRKTGSYKESTDPAQHRWEDKTNGHQITPKLILKKVRPGQEETVGARGYPVTGSNTPSPHVYFKIVPPSVKPARPTTAIGNKALAGSFPTRPTVQARQDGISTSSNTSPAPRRPIIHKGTAKPGPTYNTITPTSSKDDYVPNQEKTTFPGPPATRANPSSLQSQKEQQATPYYYKDYYIPSAKGSDLAETPTREKYAFQTTLKSDLGQYQRNPDSREITEFSEPSVRSEIPLPTLTERNAQASGYPTPETSTIPASQTTYSSEHPGETTQRDTTGSSSYYHPKNPNTRVESTEAPESTSAPYGQEGLSQEAGEFNYEVPEEPKHYEEAPIDNGRNHFPHTEEPTAKPEEKREYLSTKPSDYGSNSMGRANGEPLKVETNDLKPLETEQHPSGDPQIKEVSSPTPQPYQIQPYKPVPEVTTPSLIVSSPSGPDQASTRVFTVSSGYLTKKPDAKDVFRGEEDVVFSPAKAEADLESLTDGNSEPNVPDDSESRVKNFRGLRQFRTAGRALHAAAHPPGDGGEAAADEQPQKEAGGDLLQEAAEGEEGELESQHAPYFGKYLSKISSQPSYERYPMQSKIQAGDIKERLRNAAKRRKYRPSREHLTKIPVKDFLEQAATQEQTGQPKARRRRPVKKIRAKKVAKKMTTSTIYEVPAPRRPFKYFHEVVKDGGDKEKEGNPEQSGKESGETDPSIKDSN